MKPFVLIQSRPEEDASADEYLAFLRYTSLPQERLLRIRIEQQELPEINFDTIAGIFVGGGPFNFTESQKSPVQQRVEREMNSLLDRVVESDFPFLGACYGIGLLVPHQGGAVSSTYAEPVGATRISVVANDPILEGVPASFDAFLGHKEACETLPPNAKLLARGEKCPVQMLKIGNNVYATQFHPELDSDGLATRIRIYRNHGYFLPEEAEDLTAKGYDASVTEPMKILRNFVALYK